MRELSRSVLATPESGGSVSSSRLRFSKVCSLCRGSILTSALFSAAAQVDTLNLAGRTTWSLHSCCLESVASADEIGGNRISSLRA